MSASPLTEAPSERPTVKPKDTKRHAVLPPKRFSDISMDPPPHPLQVSPSPPQAFHSGLPLSLWNWGMEQGSVCLCMCVAACLFWSFEDIFEESVQEEHRTARGSGSGERMWAGGRWGGVVTLLSAGPWSPGPRGGWWHWFSPTPPPATPKATTWPSPGPSSPRTVASGSFVCPPTLSCWGSVACPTDKEDRMGGEKIPGVENGHKLKALRCFGACLLFDLLALPVPARQTDLSQHTHYSFSHTVMTFCDQCSPCNV